MARRPVVWVAWVTAAVVFVEAVVLVAVAALLSRVVGLQQMSLAGLKPSAMSLGAWIGCGAAALFSLVCAATLVRTAVRDQPPGRAGRILLIVSAVLHGVLGAVASALLGWVVFAVLMVGLGLLVWVLLAYGEDGTNGRAAAPERSHPQVREGHVQLQEKPAE
ncbi:hypothetical protein [Streptomyces sp. NBC_01497]|uniref:hypothetical protein n=1 Tax=Streptomyces sp. NBC_01497 TaxID=2903885 RepID=UPI002E308B97|nr:hypothetical protein [Streptomyces sp. NBC_01497]